MGQDHWINLESKELKDELTTRSISTDGMRKSEMEEIFDEMRAGINNVPALLQSNPEMCLSDLHLDKYEISPTEPLHDLKGHISNILDEVQKTATGDILNEIQKIVKTVLNKETLRCSDYRKAIILIFNSLLKVDAQHDITILFQTLVELSEILYSREQMRTPSNILRLHNTSFVHGMLCIKLFSSPQTMTRRKMFGRYFHALLCHAPIQYRTIALRSLNTDNQERMFSKPKESLIRPQTITQTRSFRTYYSVSKKSRKLKADAHMSSNRVRSKNLQPHCLQKLILSSPGLGSQNTRPIIKHI